MKSKYWLNLEQWSKDPEFNKLAKNEFMSPLPGEDESTWHRREFLQLMAASMALAGLSCVRRPTEKIVPYVNRPEDIRLGESNDYSSSFFDGDEGLGIVVKTREGRPIKIEGNDLHPVNGTGLSVRAHSHLLSLYDPERLKRPLQNLFNEKKTNSQPIGVSAGEADQEIIKHFKEGKAAFLTGHWPSPSSQKLLKEFCNAFPCSHYVWHPLNQRPLSSAWQKCYGSQGVVPRLLLDHARLILSINCDFLGTWFSPTEMSRLYSRGRLAGRDMNRLIVVESLMSLTGSNADLRIRIKPSQQLDFVLAVIYSLLEKGGLHETEWPKDWSEPQNAWEYFSISHEVWEHFIQNLWDTRGQSIVLAGGPQSQTREGEAMQVAVLWLNHLLGNYRLFDTARAYAPPPPDSKNAGVEDLIKDIENDKIKMLVIHKNNPLYSYPGKDRLKSALKKLSLVVYTGDRADETGKFAHIILPDHHDLEKWMDWEFQKGVLSIGQPSVRPLFETRAFEDALFVWAKGVDEKAAFLKGKPDWLSYLKAGHSESEWTKLLQTGVKINRKIRLRKRRRRFKRSALEVIQSAREAHKTSVGKSWPFLFSSKKEQALQGADTPSSGEELELVLYTTSGLKDGTLSNVSWLQEFPDPVTKICWDNYLCISPGLARRMNLKEAQMVSLKKGETLDVKLPVHIQPGQANGVVGLALGYGREGAGVVANQVGTNAWPFVEESKQGVVFSGFSVSLSAHNEFYKLANVQGHHSMEGRQIVVESSLKSYLKNPGGDIHRHKVFSLWSSHDYPKHKWGMVVNLNSCTGCSACIVACQSENNIPVVGKDLVLEGREMHWIRIDRYYKGEPDHPSALHQPIVCQHCDHAPCETVCPVGATVQSDEGTNDMIYNRCVGTRYCANNCPYKVRRFNWFNYTKNIKKPLDKALNPDVTVRSRGVMEKCTFCVHKIREGQARAKLEGRELKDGDIQTACQLSCPTGAIVFGDLKNPHSKVNKLFDADDSYSLLEELNTKPAVRYRVKVRNPLIEESNDQNGHHAAPSDHHK